MNFFDTITRSISEIQVVLFLNVRAPFSVTLGVFKLLTINKSLSLHICKRACPFELGLDTLSTGEYVKSGLFVRFLTSCPHLAFTSPNITQSP